MTSISLHLIKLCMMSKLTLLLDLGTTQAAPLAQMQLKSSV